MKIKLLKLELDIDSIIIGERVKGGIYRPCLETIPSSTVRGAFKYSLGLELKGVGYFKEGTYEIRDFTYSITDKLLNVAKMPIITSCLYPSGGEKIKAFIYVAYDDSLNENMFQNMTIFLGALKSKGFGKAKITNVKEVPCKIMQGLLKVRVIHEDATALGITPISPVYGYLFYPKNLTSGVYKRALFEGSLVRAPEVFLKEVTCYDE